MGFISIASTVVISSFLKLSACYIDFHPLQLYIPHQFIIFESVDEGVIFKSHVVSKKQLGVFSRVYSNYGLI